MEHRLELLLASGLVLASVFAVSQVSGQGQSKSPTRLRRQTIFDGERNSRTGADGDQTMSAALPT